MIVLGLLLILIAAGAAVTIVMAPTATSQVIDLSLLDVNASPLAIFIAGASSVILLGLGISLISRGTRRKASSRKELRHLRKVQAEATGATTAQAGERPGHHEPTSEASNIETGKVSGGTETGRTSGATETGKASGATETGRVSGGSDTGTVSGHTSGAADDHDTSAPR